MSPETKRCPRCKSTLPASAFGPNPKASTGLKSYCLACGRDIERKRSRARGVPQRVHIVLTDTHKTCTKCEELRPHGDFYVDGNPKSGLHSACKRCNRCDVVLRKYGISCEEYDQLWLSQDSRCAGCGSTGSKFCVDHCHATGAVRGILCAGCNLALGNTYDSPNTLRRLADYLENTS